MSPHMETYHGIVRTPADAIKLFEACRIGILPRVQRRLSEKERQSIRPGSIFVWDEREAGMRRWTDGKSWSASRVSGSFLTYREMEGKRSSGFSAPLTVTRRSNGRTPDSGRGSDDDGDNNEPEGYRYKPDGLMKQSFSITAQNGQHLHLISYYTRPGSELLMSPTSDPNLRNVIPPKGMYPDTTWCETGSSAGMNKAPIAMQNYLQNIRHMPPHPAAYPSQYAHNAYSGYPPSPITTPPYTGAPYAPGYYPPQHPAHMGPPAPAYAQHMPAHAPHYITSPQYPSHHAPPTPSHHAPPPPYSAAPPSLSPYQPSAEPVRTPISEYPPQQLSPHHPHSNYPAYTTSPREQPRAMLDTHLTSARNPQGPLPPIGTLSSPKSALPAPVLTVSPIAPAAMPAMLPPSRLSQTPPRSAGSDCKGAISSLINAESPKGAALPAIKPGPSGGAAAHDAHAINLLNSKFRV